MTYAVILKHIGLESERITLEGGIMSRLSAEQSRKRWRKVLGGKNWVIDRRPGLDTIDSKLGLAVEEQP